jgi:hypothetical protein
LRDDDDCHGVPGFQAKKRATAGGFGIHNTTNTFYMAMMAALDRGGYVGLITAAQERCMARLPWWRGYQPRLAVPLSSHAGSGGPAKLSSQT